MQWQRYGSAEEKVLAVQAWHCVFSPGTHRATDSKVSDLHVYMTHTHTYTIPAHTWKQIKTHKDKYSTNLHKWIVSQIVRYEFFHRTKCIWCNGFFFISKWFILYPSLMLRWLSSYEIWDAVGIVVFYFLQCWRALLTFKRGRQREGGRGMVFQVGTCRGTEVNLWESVFSFHLVGPGDHTLLIRLVANTFSYWATLLSYCWPPKCSP